ncbi:Protein component of the small (40S) ribosomal subunit [Sorochytrium milnesiophthora]
MVNVRDVSAPDFIRAFAAHLKKGGKLAVPTWVDLVKTGTHKELSPYDPDWFYTRCAAIARHIYLRKGVGVGGLRKLHGGPMRRGVRPTKGASPASGSVQRKALQALEKLKLLEKSKEGGRQITKNGQRELDRIAVQVVATKKEQAESEE